MKKIILIFGAISGLICGGMFFLLAPEDGQVDFENGQLYGYLTMFIALSSIFFAIRQYRDKYSNGSIGFKNAFKIGMGITCVAAVIYIVSWEIYFAQYGADFTDQYLEYLKTSLSEQGTPGEDLETQLAEAEELMKNYETNIFTRLSLTFLEIFPVGLIISLIASLVFSKWLKKK